MNLLIVLGSPRKNGNSEILAGSVAEGVRETGVEPMIVRLADLDVRPCIACGGCEKKGRCVVQDDMQPLYDQVDAADRIVICSPIYFYGVTAQAKAFIDRCQAFWARKYLLKMRSQTDPPRRGYFVGVSATRGERIFEGAVLSVQYAFDAMDVKHSGELLVRGVDKRGAITEKMDELSRAREFGRAVVAG